MIRHSRRCNIEVPFLLASADKRLALSGGKRWCKTIAAETDVRPFHPGRQ